LARLGGNHVNEVSEVNADGWENDCSEQIHEDDEAHAEAAEAAQILEDDELGQVVNGGVDPTTSLGEKDTPCLGGSRESVCVSNEFVRHLREVLRHQSGEITILTKREKVLLVQGVHVAVGILFDDLVGDDERLALVGSSETVHAETTKVSQKLT
jgi:hypothetical protein